MTEQPATARSWRIVPVRYDDPRASALRRRLDDELGARYDGFHGDEPAERRAARARALAVHADDIVTTLIAVTEPLDGAAGHVILRRLGAEWEIKRLVVDAEFRGRGIARALVAAANETARTGGAQRVILQTGVQQPESIRLYESMGFRRIPVYEPYGETMPRSVCFALAL